MRKYLYLFILLISIFTLCGCGETKKFSTREVSIEVSSDYQKFQRDPYIIYLEDDNSFIGIFKESKDVINSNIIYDFDKVTLEEYINMYCTTNNIGEMDIYESDNLTYIEYTITKSTESFFIRVFFFKTNSSFWSAQFCCYANKKDLYADSFIDWAKTIDV